MVIERPEQGVLHLLPDRMMRQRVFVWINQLVGRVADDRHSPHHARDRSFIKQLLQAVQQAVVLLSVVGIQPFDVIRVVG